MKTREYTVRRIRMNEMVYNDDLGVFEYHTLLPEGAKVLETKFNNPDMWVTYAIEGEEH